MAAFNLTRHTDLSVTPGGHYRVPIVQETESDRISYAVSHGWLSTPDNYLANRPFVAAAQLLSTDSVEFQLMLRELEHFCHFQPELEEMLMIVPVPTLNYMCPKRTHRAGIALVLNFLTTIVYLRESACDDGAHLLGLK